MKHGIVLLLIFCTFTAGFAQIDAKKLQKKPDKQTYTVEPWVKSSVSYQVHWQDFGWSNEWFKDGAVTPLKNGEEKKHNQWTGKDTISTYDCRVEAIKIKISGISGGSVLYRSYCQNIAWTDWWKNGEENGTTGKSLRMQALQVKLENCPGYIVYYKVYFPELGLWHNGQDGSIAGDPGQPKAICQVSIQLIKAASMMDRKSLISQGPVKYYAPDSYKFSAGDKNAGLLMNLLILNDYFYSPLELQQCLDDRWSL